MGEKNKENKRCRIGLCARAYEDFSEFLRVEGLDVVCIGSEISESKLPENIGAVVIDLAEDGSDRLVSEITSNFPKIPRVLITAQSADTFIDREAFALLHRPITHIELLDVIRWACDSNRARVLKKSARRSRVDIFLEDTADTLLPNIRWLSAILDNLPLGLVLFSPEGTVIRANESILQELGFGPIPVGAPCDDIVPWRDVEGAGCRISKCLSTRETLRDIFEIPNGNLLEVTHVPVVSGGQVTGVLMIIERVPPEVGLTTRIIDVASVIDEGIAFIDREMKFVWVNGVMREWFDIPEKYTDLLCSKVLHGEDGLCKGCNVVLAFEDGLIHKTYFKTVISNGEKKLFEIITGPARNHRGEINRVINIFRDVTERESVVDQLAATKGRLQNTNAALTSKIHELGMLTKLSEALQTVESLDENLHISLTAMTANQGCGFNRGFLFLIDRSEETIEGRLAIGPSNPAEAGSIWDDLMSHPATFSEVLATYQKSNDSGDIEVNRLVKEIKYSLSDKEALLVKALFSEEVIVVEDIDAVPGARELAEKINSPAFIAVPLSVIGKPVGVVVVDNMLTNANFDPEKMSFLKAVASHASLTIERSIFLDRLRDNNEKLREAYKRLRENQDFLLQTERLSTIGKLAAQVAHEIRNPLVSIGGFARNIAKRSEPESLVRSYADIIWDESQRLEEILVDVLSYSRHAEPKIRPCDLNKLIMRTLDVLDEQIQNSPVRLSMNLGDEIGEIPMDPDQIRQVVLNLIKNALAVMEKGGMLTITTHGTGGFVWIEITDTGSGIPTEVQKKVFKPFFTTKSAGTGLGLSISHQIIEAHGGMIWFTTTLDKGTTFHVKLPGGGKASKEGLHKQ